MEGDEIPFKKTAQNEVDKHQKIFKTCDCDLSQINGTFLIV